jgi:hypothetical protein
MNNQYGEVQNMNNMQMINQPLIMTPSFSGTGLFDNAINADEALKINIFENLNNNEKKEWRKMILNII